VRYIAVLIVFSLIVGCTNNARQPIVKNVSISKETTTPTPPPVMAVDEYYVIVFAYNKPVGKIRPAQTHTFATWVRSRNKQVLEQIDISWCPKQGGVRVIANEVPGKNKSLMETLQDCQNGYKLKYWVLRTDKNFFEAAQRQRENLKYYKALDHASRPHAVNCIHACSDVAGRLDTGTACGIASGQMITDHYVRTGSAWMCNDDWVATKVMSR
jgi:hypothetical protein